MINDKPINWQLSCRRVPPLLTTHWWYCRPYFRRASCTDLLSTGELGPICPNIGKYRLGIFSLSIWTTLEQNWAKCRKALTIEVWNYINDEFHVWNLTATNVRELQNWLVCELSTKARYSLDTLAPIGHHVTNHHMTLWQRQWAAIAFGIFAASGYVLAIGFISHTESNCLLALMCSQV